MTAVLKSWARLTYRPGPNAILICIYSLSAITLAGSIYFSILEAYVVALAYPFAICSVLIATVYAIYKRPTAPLRYLLLDYPMLHGKNFVLCTVGFFLTIAAFTTFRNLIPQIVPFYADRYLANLGEFLHYGVAPWRLVHRMPEFVAPVIDIFYSKIWFVAVLVFYLQSALTLRDKELQRPMLSVLLVAIILGAILATAFSSVGPIFYDRFYGSHRFAELSSMITENSEMAGVQLFSSFLYEAYLHKQHSFGSGITAMPSMHVAMATLIAWHATSFSKVMASVGWTFLAIILVGSIYTGWHYAVDGYFSVIATSAIWIVVSKRLGLRLLGSVKL